MAKKTGTAVTAADLFDDLTDVLGENAEAAEIRGWLDTGLPELNFALAGDFARGGPMGRLLEIFGPASSGKTFISTLMMKAVQNAGGIAFFSDHERSFSPEFAKALGMNTDPKVFRHLKPLSFEDSIEAFMKVVPMVRAKGLPIEVPIIWVFDSVASMIPRAKLVETKGNKEVARVSAEFNMKEKLALATACSQNYPILKQFSEDHNCMVLMLNQIRMKPGILFGDPTTTPGGMAAEFYADIRLSLGKQDITNGLKGPEREVVGAQITAKAIKNKVARPFRKAIWKVRFNDELGAYVDRIDSTVDFMIRRGVLEKNAQGRVDWDGKKPTVAELVKLLKADPNGWETLMGFFNKSLTAGKVVIEEDDEFEGDGETEGAA